MNTEAFEYFYSVAEGNTFFTTAENFHTSQSVVSKAIRQLENQLGTELLCRKGRSAKLTHAGQVLYEDLKTLKPAYQNLLENQKHLRQVQEICCCAIPSYNIFGLAEAISAFTGTHPLIELNMQKASSREKLPEAEKMDCVISHCVNLAPEDVILAWDEVLLLLPNEHPLAKKENLCMKDLTDIIIMANTRMVDLLTRLQERYETSLHLIDTRKQEHPFYTDRVAAVSYVYMNHGIIAYMASDIEELNLRRITVRRIDDLPRIPLVISPNKNKKNPALQTFIGFLTERCLTP